MAEMTQSCKRQWAEVRRTRYQNNLEPTIRQLRSAIERDDDYSRAAEAWSSRHTDWGRSIRELHELLKFEREGKPGPASDFAVELIPKIRERARDFRGTRMETVLSLTADGLEVSLPYGIEANLTLPRIDGSSGFRQAVAEVFGNLTPSERVKLSDVVFRELDSRRVAGMTWGAKVRFIVVAAGQSPTEMRKTITHECGHIVLEHDESTLGTEDEVARWMKTRGFPKP